MDHSKYQRTNQGSRPPCTYQSEQESKHDAAIGQFFRYSGANADNQPPSQLSGLLRQGVQGSSLAFVCKKSPLERNAHQHQYDDSERMGQGFRMESAGPENINFGIHGDEA